ncbi:MAG: ATP-dependent zinc metalloprotease FtsH [Bacteroidota bacterium]
MSDTPEKNKDNKDKKFNPLGDFNRMGGSGSNQQQKLIRNVFLWVILFATTITIYMFMHNTQKPVWPVSYTQYMKFLNENEINYVVIKKSQINDYELNGELKRNISVNIDGQMRDIKGFTTKLGFIDRKTEELWESKGLAWKYEEGESPMWNILLSILPWVLIIGLYIFFMRRMQGGGGGPKGIFSFGKARVHLMNESSVKVTFQDVAGADEAKYELEEIIEFLKEPAKFQRLGGRIPRGVLLLGPPGTGKTLLARAIAGEANVPFYSMSGADFVEMFVGVGASRVRDLFEQAKKSSPCIVFIDEIDAVGRHRGAGLGGGHDEREQTLNQLLVEMDGFEQNSGVIIIAATNRPDVLDPALLRPGRFDRQVVVDRPDIKGREGIFQVHTKKIPLGDDVKLDELARGTPGLSGADIANIVNEAALLGARRNSDKVTMYDFENAKDKVLMGIERKSLVISDEEKEMTSYHEMGHALVGLFLPDSDPVHKITIIPRGRALGITSHLPLEDKHSFSKSYVETHIVILMAGRAAEKLIFNSLSTGAANDIEKATQLARKMVCDWGMSEEIGPVKYANQQEEVFLGREISQPRDHSEHTAQAIDNAVREIVLGAYNRAESILKEHIDTLHRLSKVLLEREVLDGEELNMLLRGEILPELNKKTLEALKSIRIDEHDFTTSNSSDSDLHKTEANVE